MLGLSIPFKYPLPSHERGGGIEGALQIHLGNFSKCFMYVCKGLSTLNRKSEECGNMRF